MEPHPRAIAPEKTRPRSEANHPAAILPIQAADIIASVTTNDKPEAASLFCFTALANVLHGVTPELTDDLPDKYGDLFLEAVRLPPYLAFDMIVDEAERDPELAAGLAQAINQKPAPRFTLDDSANAARLVFLWGWRLRFVFEAQTWYVWQGQQWVSDSAGKVLHLTVSMAEAFEHDACTMRTQTQDQRRGQAEILAHGHKSRSERARQAMRNLAQAVPGVTLRLTDFDTAPMVFNVANGTVDLRTGTLRPHRPDDFLTMLSPVAFDSAASCPAWERFLWEVFNGQADLVEYAQRAIGYSLTGSTREQVFLILHGHGANGKSTLLETIHALLGDYANHANVESFMTNDRRDQKRDDVAALRGARLVSASESSEGQRLDERTIKEITGGEAITCRHLHGRYFSYHPAFKIWLATNHKPQIRNTDFSIWRRVHLVPFTQCFTGEKCDKDLPARLREELPGILAWAVRGCLAWQRNGLQPPAAVLTATEEYRSDSDVLGNFLDEVCVLDSQVSEWASALYEAYQQWSARNGYRAMNTTMFGTRLSERALDKRKVNGRVKWHGIGLVVDSR